MIDRMLRLKAVMDATGLPRSTIYELIAAGKFPKPCRISPRAVAWPESEVAQYLADCRARRDDEVEAA